MAFTLHQVYERVPLHGQAAELLVIDGEYACPDGHDANVPIEVRITSPAVAVTSWNGNTGAGFPSFVPTGTVHCELPAWSPQMCGQIITLEVRGFCKGVFTPWETHQAMVGPRSDAGRTWKRKVDGTCTFLRARTSPRGAGIRPRCRSCCGACGITTKRPVLPPKRAHPAATGRCRMRR
jgi:hypothetical protein